MFDDLCRQPAVSGWGRGRGSQKDEFEQKDFLSNVVIYFTLCVCLPVSFIKLEIKFIKSKNGIKLAIYYLTIHAGKWHWNRSDVWRWYKFI